MEMEGRSLDELRRSARGLENGIEATLVAYSNLASSASSAAFTPSSSAEPAPVERLERELSAQLEHEILHDYSAEFGKTRASIKAAHERASLLDTVRLEIRDYRATATPAGGRAGETTSLLRERNALHNAMRSADEVLGRAHSTQSNLHDQRGMLTNIRRNVIGIAVRVPALASLIANIGARKRRDVLVLGGTTGVCVVLLIWATIM
ncbi:hypothetical protein T492DRAFT_903293 [Pavlovales sp. CCMP2436]|nr:hypothetical protein T492DRAFT_903293 [Pavlovales sp. CCMP2436]